MYFYVALYASLKISKDSFFSFIGISTGLSLEKNGSLLSYLCSIKSFMLNFILVFSELELSSTSRFMVIEVFLKFEVFLGSMTVFFFILIVYQFDLVSFTGL
jgi:hypothetical protein